jgi:hypothetical protein
MNFLNSNLAGFCRLLPVFLGLVSTTARADWVTEWNATALSAMRTTSAAPLMTRDLAMLHVAMYNASETLQNNYTPYSFGGYTASGPMSGPAGASIEAAVATAANTIMQSLYAGSSASFTSLYNSQLASIADNQSKTDGITWGQSIANDILTWRASDGAAAAGGVGYVPVGTVGYWNQTSASPAQYAGWGSVGTFAIGSTAAYQSSLPGGTLAGYLATGQYATDFNQVKEFGSSSSPTRSLDETTQAYFWSAPSGSVQVPGMWNQVAQSVAASSGLTISDSTRLFAALNVSMADAGIAALTTAYDVQFWRPETGIANGGDGFGDIDGNPSTEGDGAWAPLISSPDFPEYVSLTGAFSGAAAAVLTQYAGSSYAFTLGGDIDGDGNTEVDLTFPGFAEASQHAVMSGVYAGTQFASSAIDGASMGTQIGEDVTQNFFQNVPEPSGILLTMVGLGWFGARRRRA